MVLLAVTQARLQDGTVVTFRHALPQPPSDWPLRLLGLLALLAVVVALLSGWAVRRLTRPLASLADAADGLARNLDQKPLEEKGPQEVQRAARSFNAMQRALKAYLETRAQALAGVSHDLRLPLTRLRLRLEQLPEGDSRAAMQRDIEEMDAMVGGTLDYLRAGSDTEQAVKLNLNALVEGLAEDAEAAGAKVSLHGTAAPVTARPQALRRCLANLIDNARRYGGGEVEVTLRRQRRVGGDPHRGPRRRHPGRGARARLRTLCAPGSLARAPHRRHRPRPRHRPRRRPRPRRRGDAGRARRWRPAASVTLPRR